MAALVPGSADTPGAGSTRRELMAERDIAGLSSLMGPAAEVERGQRPVLEQAGAGTGVPDASPLQYDPVGRQPEPGADILLHQQDRGPRRMQSLDSRVNLAGNPGLQPGRRFVEDQEPGGQHHAAGDLYAPLLPAGQVSVRLAGPCPKQRKPLL